MDPAILVVFCTLFLFLALSVPIGVALGFSVVLGIFVGNMPATFFIQKMFASLNSFPLLAVPFFIMAGEIMQKGSMADRLLDLARASIGHITGGMAQVTVVASLFFAALSGSSPATVAAIGEIMIPSMQKDGYDLPFATAVTTAAGCLGVMIPPSVPLIIYGTTAGVSVGDLFIAGIIPGILVASILMLTVYIIAKLRGFKSNGSKATHHEVILATFRAIPALTVPVIVLGGIYSGIITPTEAGVIAVFYALFMETVILRTLSVTAIWHVLRRTTLTTASIFLIIATATVFGQMLLFYSIPDLLVNSFSQITTNKHLILLILILFMVVAGMFIDALANILILTPLLLPVAENFGINSLHFGIFMVTSVAIGFLTPPVGVNLFVGCGISGLSIERLTIAIIPFLIAITVALIIIAYWPPLSLVLL